MNIRITEREIIKRCGEVSYKTGAALVQKDKVELDCGEESCTAAVHASNESFHVTIRRGPGGTIEAQCSCPKLASVTTDCQHIAAALIALKQQSAMSGRTTIESIFTKSRSGHISPVEQVRFEDRSVLDTAFTIHKQPDDLLGIRLWIGPDKILVSDIAAFLYAIEKGHASSVYRPEEHCFERKTYKVLELLTEIISTGNAAGKNQLLLIPPAYWKQLSPLLADVPNAPFRLIEDKPQVHFQFKEEADGTMLTVTGMSELIMLPSYAAVLQGKNIYQLSKEQLDQLKQLRMLKETFIRDDELKSFTNKILPQLQSLGHVDVTQEVAQKLREDKLVANLYLDRVSGRLLASLEFNYGKLSINPSEEEHKELFRDIDKEEEILNIMKEYEFTETDSGYYMHNEELEYEFLHYGLRQIEKLVRVHATTAVRERVLSEPFKPRLEIRIKKERTDWLEFKFDMNSIPQNEIKDLLQALEEKRKYYRLRSGSLLTLETEEFTRLNEFLNGLTVTPAELEMGYEVPIARGLGLIQDSELFDPQDSFKSFLKEIEAPDHHEAPVPEELEETLRSYQITGYKWMKTLASHGFGGILADDMGLGKTIQAITFILSELTAIRESGKPVLVVCPSAVTYNWQSEVCKFAKSVQAIIMDGKPAERIQKQKAALEADVLITSYPILLQDEKWYTKQQFHTVFFDEAQSFKNPATRTARIAAKIQAKYRFALTGTPIENSLEELWSIFHVVFPELFGSVKDYSELSRKQIARRARPFMLRRTKADVLHELPGKTESIERSELLPEQKKLYGAYLAKLRHDTFRHLDQETKRKNKIRILAGITRLRQICCHPGLFVEGYTGRSAKLDQLLEILEEADQRGRRVLVFSQFTSMLGLIGGDLARSGRDFFYLDGSTPAAERLDLCNRFNEGECNLFLISLKAGGTGLNLTGADTVILYDTWWNPAVESQAADRAHRMGQEREVQVIKLVAKGTIEEKINELQEKKRALINEVVENADETMSYALTDEDIEWLIGDGNGE